jgi:eukaryotic-like serine/threonine-protein kinase
VDYPQPFPYKIREGLLVIHAHGCPAHGKIVRHDMPLTSGTRLGPYEVLAPIGAGGMGEVYRARDTRLDRTVAVKILPSHLSENPEAKQRFDREARTISSVNHPNICSLYDVGHQDGIDFLVMEYLEGETLADRLRKGPLPIIQVLRYGIESCEGLEKAHRSGMVHRDLKPGNIMLTKSGAKLMDFGLAKASFASSAAISELTATLNTPPVSHPLTAQGTVLGTFHYMSPEQVEGKEADARSDIFALGAVLYEMVTGKRAFEGKTAPSVMAAVLERDPTPISSVQPLTPPALERLVKTCLAKDPDERWQTAHDVKLQLEWLRDVGSQASLPASLAAPRRISHRVFWAIAIVVIAMIALFAGMYFRPANAPEVPIVSQISSPEGEGFVLQGAAAGPPVLSPDGQRLAFVAVGSDGKQRLWVRQLGAPTAQPLQGSDGCSFPFWSPDSRYIGFFANNKLSRIDASGGPPLAIADVAASWGGGTWSRDGTILFAPNVRATLIYRVPASGGTPQPVTKLDPSRGEDRHLWPQFLPDGKHFLFYSSSKDPQNNATYAASLDGGERKLLVHGDSNAVFAPPGYLLFLREGTLIAQRFDPGSSRLTGDAAPLAEHASSNLSVGRGNFTASENGILTYAAGSGSAGTSRLLWFDRSGKQLAETGEPGAYFSPRISPNGRNLALAIEAPGTVNYNLWVFDLSRSVPTRLTFSSALDGHPAWSPDGRTITFLSNRSGQFHIYQTAADGTGDTSAVIVDDAAEYNPSFSPDGRYMIFQRLSAQSGAHFEIWAKALFGDPKPFPVVQSEAAQPALSPDGKWLAYSSRESGRPEIYVVPFRQGSGRWQVSTAGGTWPRWRHDGKELFYLSLDKKITSAEISMDGSRLVVGNVAPLFQVNVATSLGWFYDVSTDGKRFVVLNQDPRQAAEPLTLVVNWPALLKKQ